MQDLIIENDLGNGILFIIGAIRHFLEIPILVVMPKVKEDASIVGGKSFLFERCHLYVEDQYLTKDDFQIKPMFNGWDYFCPFVQHDIGNIMNVGLPAMEKVQYTCSTVRKLSERVPIFPICEKLDYE